MFTYLYEFILQLSYLSLSYKADFGSGDFQSLVLVLLASREHAHDMLLVSVLVSEVELKLSIIRSSHIITPTDTIVQMQ
jgi:hypothetical protein